MTAIVDFLSGRSNKLLRDILGSSIVVALLSVAAVSYIRAAVDVLRVARQPLPSKIENAQSGRGSVITVTRSVLDEPLYTGTVGSRNIVLDPCTGKEKK